MSDLGTHAETIVIGGGWAGLATSIHLAKQRLPLTLIESAKQLGGRARSTPFDGLMVDNGQHLMIGAYSEMLRLLHTLGVREHEVLLRTPLHLLLRSALNHHDVSIKMPPLPAPLHVGIAILFGRGISTNDKWQAIRFCIAMLRQDFILGNDCKVSELLSAHRQSGFMITHFWSPICIGALNTPVHQASAQLFVNVLKRSFTGKRGFSDLLIARTPLGDLIPQPAANFLGQHGAAVMLSTRVTGLKIERGRITGIRIGEQNLPAQQVVLALPPYRCLELLSPHPAFDSITEQLRKFTYEPICTVYLQYPAATCLLQAMIGVTDGISQWIFDRRICSQPGLMAVVISTHGIHMEWDNNRLAETVEKELAILFPHWPRAEKRMVIREKRATFTSRPGINASRPQSRTPVKGVWLAGDYTDTGLPATLEGAIQSGVQCAQQLINT